MRPLIVLTTLAGLLISGCGGDAGIAPSTQSPEGTAVRHEVANDEAVASGPTELSETGDLAGMGPGSAEGEEAPAADAFASTAGESKRSLERHLPSGDPSARKQQIQSGTLTAGSLNDHDGYDEFLDYVLTARQRATGQTLTAFDGRRIPIRVVGAQGSPIAGARVTIAAIEVSVEDGQTDNIPLRYGPKPAEDRAQEQTRQLITLRTGSDGRTALVPSLDGVDGVTEFAIVVETAEGTTATQRETIENSEWVITVDQTGRALPRQLDLALVIDTTGSMSDELEYLKVEIDSIAARIKRLFPDVDQRYTLILYRDNGDEYVTRTFDFTGSISEFRTQLSQQRAAGGGDYPEAMQEALKQSTQLSWREGSTARVAFLVGDAPPHAEHIDQTLDAVMALRQKEITLFPIAASGVQDEAEYVMRISAFLTMGQYLFLTDHSGVGNPHAKPTAPKYTVERLDQLMVRMVASELAGEPVLARDIIAIEESGGPYAPPNPLPQQASTECKVEYDVPTCRIQPENVALNCGPPVSFLLEWFDQPVFGMCCLAALVFLEFRFARRV